MYMCEKSHSPRGNVPVKRIANHAMTVMTPATAPSTPLLLFEPMPMLPGEPTSRTCGMARMIRNALVRRLRGPSGGATS
jgi:hypothetical protein